MLLSLRSMPYEDMETLIDDIDVFCRPSHAQDRCSSIYKQDCANPAIVARGNSFQTYTAAMVSSDYSAALDAVLRFFDAESAPFAGGLVNNRGLRQHALLNLASFHLHHSEYAAARQACAEGMRVARQVSDMVTLSALTSTLKIVELESKKQAVQQKDAEDEIGLSERITAKEDPGGYVTPMDWLRDLEHGQTTVKPAGVSANRADDLLRSACCPISTELQSLSSESATIQLAGHESQSIVERETQREEAAYRTGPGYVSNWPGCADKEIQMESTGHA